MDKIMKKTNKIKKYALFIICITFVLILGEMFFYKSEVNADVEKLEYLDGRIYYWNDEIGELIISGTGDEVDWPLTIFSGPNISKETLKILKIEGNYNKIPSFEFEDCVNLTDVTISGGITSIESGAFDGCTSLKNVVIPEGVTTIELSTFSECTSLENITIPNGVTTIGWAAFSNCTSLRNINIPESVINIDKRAFWHCTNLEKIHIPNSVTNIGEGAFEGCTNLKTVNIPKGVKDIEKDTFYNCTNLTNVDIAEGVTNINRYAFHGCTNLTEINIPESVINIDYGAFGNCESLVTINIPKNVTNIEENAFWMCKNLINITLPENITSIKKETFSWCTSLTSINIPDSVTNIDVAAFANCSNLSNIIMPKNLVSIGLRSFSSCYNLTEVTIPENVTDIGDYAFSSCKKLTKIIIPKNVINFGDDIFDLCSPELTIYGYKNSEAEKYANANNIKFVDLESGESISENIFTYTIDKYSNDITITGIKDEYKENGIVKFNKMTIPNTIGEYKVKRIGIKAFENTNITSVNISEGIEIIEMSAFANCSELIKVQLPNTLKTISSNAFSGDSKLLQVSVNESLFKMPTELEIIDKYAFNGTAISGKIIIPKNVKTIGESAFMNCKNIKELDIQSIYITEIPINMCYGDSKLKTVTLLESNSITTIGRNAFKDCIELTNIKLPYLLKEIQVNTFENCKKLNDINIPTSVNNIGVKAFAECSNLVKIIVPDTVNNIANGAFDNHSTKLIMYVYKDSYAEKYANENNIEFKYINELNKKGFVFGKDNYSFLNTPGQMEEEDRLFDLSAHYWNLLMYKMNNSVQFVGLLMQSAYTSGNILWGGSCFGIAATELLFYKNMFSPKQFENVDTVFELKAPVKNEKLKQFINFYYALQSLPDFWNEQVYDAFNSPIIEEIDGFTKLDDSKLCEKLINNLKNKNEPQVIGFSMLLNYNGEDITAGHAILALDVEEDIYYINNKIYKYKIRICDSNYESEQYIYIKEDFSDWYYDAYDIVVKGEMQLKNLAQVYSYEKFQRYNALTGQINPEDVKYNSVALIEWDSSIIDILNESRTGIFYDGFSYYDFLDLSDATHLVASIIRLFKADNNSNTVNMLALENLDHYTIKPHDDKNKDINIMMTFPNSTYSVKTTNTEQVYMSNPGKLTLNGTNSNYELQIATNDCQIPWFMLKVQGENINNLTIENIKEGYILEGDNLHNVKILAQNMEEKVELQLDTNEKNILIKSIKEDTALGIFEDKDNDGVYESLIQEVKPGETDKVSNVEGENNNIVDTDIENNIKDESQANTTLPQTGSINKNIIIIVIIVNLILIYFIKKKLINKI